MQKSIKNLLYKSHLSVIALASCATLLIILSFVLRFSYSNTKEIISDIRVNWENADRNIQLSVTRWLKGKPFKKTKESIKHTTDNLLILKKRTNTFLYPKDFRKDIQQASQSWKLLNEEKLESIMEKLDAFTKSNSFLKMETEDKLKYFETTPNNYLQNLNLRELIYNYKTRNNGKWDKLTQQGVELLDQINLMYTYTDSFSKKLESIAEEIDSLLKIITLLCFISVAILVILQVIIGLLLTKKTNNLISSPLMQSSQKLINFVGKSLENQENTDDNKFLNEVEQLQYSVDTLINYYNQIAQTAEKLAIGDTTENITPVSQNDVIGNAFYDISSYLQNLARGANEIIDGNYDYKIDEKSEKDILAQTYNRLAVSISDLLNKTKEIARLESEFQAASKIQSSMLPMHEEHIAGYELSHSLITATEVGGDNYDFRHCSKGNWFSIGDVSGHGLEAGIIALIAQSAFNYGIYLFENLEENEKLPIEMYQYVNKTVYLLNKQRNNSDSFITMNYFFEHDGKFYGAGAHESPLIYRAATGEVEEFKQLTGNTLFLGIIEEIDAEPSYCSFELYPDDILLLYTDGLIEAKNENNEQFDIPRVKDLLKKYANLPLSEIKEKIYSELSSFTEKGDRARYNGKFADDVTIFLIKKKA
ncbi:MAG: SpoIIE family protein phosphatase [Spirochaetales bacterium]|nr:SpoIIE family protein phosphatase [Spirochaetales bacterium]